jgi:hypothetical protein
MNASVRTALAFVAASVALGSAQAPQTVVRPGEMPAAPSATSETEGTASVQGHVTSADGSALSGAHILLTNTTTGLANNEEADESGRYIFERLPAGTYQAAAKMTGYVSLEFGARQANDAPRRFAVADGEAVTRIDFTLPRVGAIAGRVVDETGDPVQGAMASVYAMAFVNGRRALVPQGNSRPTDDLGRFRIFGLQPDHYIVAAAAATVGRYRMPGYVRVFYPGSPSLGDAQGVDLPIGDDVAGLELRLMPGHAARITGTATGADGAPFGQQVTLSPRAQSEGLAAAPTSTRAENGAFIFSDVAVGQYVLKAFTFSPTGMQFGVQLLNVEGDMVGVPLHLSYGSRVNGRIVLEGAESRVLPRDFSMMFKATAEDASPDPGSFRAKINDDWTFDYNGLFGPMLLRASGRAEWLLKSIRANGVDVTDTPLPFGRAEQSLTGVEVTLTNRGAQVTASVADGRGQPAAACNAMVFSTDRRQWQRFTRFVKTTRCDPDGTVTVRALPGGDYFIVATDRLIGSDDGGGWQDADYLEGLSGSATRVTLTEGQTTAVSLRLVTR